jgi:hypothetical protein
MAGNIEVDKIERATDIIRKRIILQSPDGTLWEVTVDNSGNLITNKIAGV